jgi:CoA:oxalate CoA-transferase
MERFAEDIGKPELSHDSRFNPYQARWENRHALETIIEDWLRSFEMRQEALKFLLERHYLAAPVLSLSETVELIKREGRGALQQANIPGYGEIWLPKAPYLFSETKVEFEPILSLLGEDNGEILSKYLGYSEQRLTELRNEGILIEDKEIRKSSEADPA